MCTHISSIGFQESQSNMLLDVQTKQCVRKFLPEYFCLLVSPLLIYIYIYIYFNVIPLNELLHYYVFFLSNECQEVGKPELLVWPLVLHYFVLTFLLSLFPLLHSRFHGKILWTTTMQQLSIFYWIYILNGTCFFVRLGINVVF